MAAEKIPVWLDCDPGHDDAFAILLAAHHPAFDLLGISTVHGNASLDRSTENACSILTAIGCDHIPVFPGSRKPFCRDPCHAPNIHGISGLDGTSLLPRPAVPPVVDTNAILAMRKALLGAPRNTSWLIATGALTNVALLFSAFPEVASWIKGLSIMGGAIGGGLTDAPISKMPGEQDRVGNITPWAEFNIHCDPESAHSIFSNPALASKTTLIPLDLTHQVLATPPILARLLPSQQQSPQAPSTQQANVSTSSPTSTSIRARNLRPLFHDLLTYFASTYARVFGISAGPPLHDPLAVAVVLADHPDPEYRIWFSDESSARDAEVSTRWHIDVVTAGDTGEISHNNMLGRTVAKPITRRPSTSSPLAPGNGGNPLDNDPVVDSLGLRSNVPSSPNGVGGGVRIMRAVDVEKFWTVILEGSVVRAEEALGPSR